MNRREALLGAVCCLSLGACAPLSRSSTRPPTGAGANASAANARARLGRGEVRAGALAPDEAIELSVKPVGEAGALARQTGHCDLDGVLAAHGSSELARSACDRDVQVEEDIADGLRVSMASGLQKDARMRHMAGDVDNARLDYHEAIRQDTDGRSPSAVSAFARINLGLLHHEQGDQVTAEEHLRWVLDNSTDTAVRGAAYHNLSLVLLELDDTDGALDAAQRGHRLLRRALGASHGSVGASLNALGVIHAERDELDDAVEALEAAIETRTIALGRQHPATAASYTNLGVALGRIGAWDDALLAHQEALSIDEEVLGAEHATTAADHGHVGAALMQLGHTQFARDSFEDALAILEPARANDDPEVLRLREWLETCDAAQTRPS